MNCLRGANCLRGPGVETGRYQRTAFFRKKNFSHMNCTRGAVAKINCTRGAVAKIYCTCGAVFRFGKSVNI
jgi:hypothetical protein